MRDGGILIRDFEWRAQGSFDRVRKIDFLPNRPSKGKELSMSSIWPSGGCTARSTWQVIGGVWKPINPPTFQGNCTAALSFVNAAGPFIIKPPDSQTNPEYLRLTSAMPAVPTPDGLSPADVHEIDARFPGTKQLVAGQSGLFTLPMVPFGTAAIDLRPTQPQQQQ